MRNQGYDAYLPISIFFGLILRENGRVRYAGFIIICNVKSPRKLYNIQIVCAFRFIKQNVYQRSEDTRHTNTVYQLYIQRRCRGLLLGSSSYQNIWRKLGLKTDCSSRTWDYNVNDFYNRNWFVSEVFL